jgi:hypothetical protein
VGLKLKGAHQLLAYADDVNLLRDNIDTVASSDIQHFTFTTQLYLINDNKYRSLAI